MISLALRSSAGEAAAALAVDGRVRAALRRGVADGCRSEGATLDRVALDVCQIAGVKPAAIRQLAYVRAQSAAGAAASTSLVLPCFDAALQRVVTPVDGLLRLVERIRAS